MFSDLPALRGRYTTALFDDWLPFLDAHVIDLVHGGFPCEVRPDGTRASTARSTWFEGRGVWVYAHLYSSLAPDQRYLDVAARTLKLLDRTRPAGRPSGRPRALNPDGTAAAGPDPEVYSDLFVAEGMAAFAHATGDDAMWHDAAAVVIDCLSRVREPDYRAALHYVTTPDGTPLDGADHPGVRPLGVWMLLVRTLTELLGHRSDAALAAELRGAIDVILTRYRNPRFDLLKEVLDPDLQPSTGPAPRFVYLGHAIETLWMVMDAVLVIDDRETFDAAASLFRRHCEVARDPVYGGLFRALVDVDAATYTLDKTLWVQQEAMIGALLLVEHRDDIWGSALFGELDAYVHERFPLRELDSVMWREQTDRAATALPERPRVENYHHPRWLMRVLETLDRIEGNSP